MVLFRFGRLYLRRLPCLPWHATRARAQVVHDTSPALDRTTAAAAADDLDARLRPTGPGWFTSSWDLCRGLDVIEACVAGEPLAEWSTLVARHRFEPFGLGRIVGFGSRRPERHEQPGAGLVLTAAHGGFGDALQFGDLDLAVAVGAAVAVAAEVAHLDPFSQFRIDGLELL